MQPTDFSSDALKDWFSKNRRRCFSPKREYDLFRVAALERVLYHKKGIYWEGQSWRFHRVLQSRRTNAVGKAIDELRRDGHIEALFVPNHSDESKVTHLVIYVR